MWIRNIRTKHKWFVTEEHGKKLLKQEDYEKVEPDVDINDLNINGLKKLAAEKGIDPNQSKEDLIKALGGEKQSE